MILEEMIPTDPAAAQAGIDAGPQAPAAGPRSQLATLHGALDAASDLDGVADAGLALARAHVEAAGLLLVRDGQVIGFRASGEGISAQIGTVSMPIETPSLFALPAVRQTPFHGRPPSDGIDGRLMEAIERAHVEEVLVQPICIRGRVVNLLYADNGGSPLSDAQVAALHSLCAAIAGAYERLILAGKLQR